MLEILYDPKYQDPKESCCYSVSALACLGDCDLSLRAQVQGLGFEVEGGRFGVGSPEELAGRLVLGMSVLPVGAIRKQAHGLSPRSVYVRASQRP